MIGFIIAIDGKTFIDGSDGKVPDVRLDLKFKKSKCRSLKMCLKQEDAEQMRDDIASAIIAENDELDEEDLKNIIWGIVKNKVC